MDERLKQLLVLGREHYERREYDRAERLLLQVLEVTDRYADVFNMLAVICHDRADFAAAEGYFERAVEINPHYTEALLNLAVTYNDLGKYEAARQIYARVRGAGKGQEGGPDAFVRGKLANMHADLAQAYSDAGIRGEAIEQLRKAVDLCPTFADLQTKLGTLYRDDGNLPQARRCYEAARAENARFVPARVLLGVTLLTLGAIDEAIAEWREALVIEPDNRSARMYLRMVEAQRSGAVTTGDPQRVPAVTMGDPQRVPAVTMGDPQRVPAVTMGDPQRVPQTPPVQPVAVGDTPKPPLSTGSTPKPPGISTPPPAPEEPLS